MFAITSLFSLTRTSIRLKRNPTSSKTVPFTTPAHPHWNVRKCLRQMFERFVMYEVIANTTLFSLTRTSNQLRRNPNSPKGSSIDTTSTFKLKCSKMFKVNVRKVWNVWNDRYHDSILFDQNFDSAKEKYEFVQMSSIYNTSRSPLNITGIILWPRFINKAFKFRQNAVFGLTNRFFLTVFS